MATGQFMIRMAICPYRAFPGLAVCGVTTEKEQETLPLAITSGGIPRFPKIPKRVLLPQVQVRPGRPVPALSQLQM